MKRLYISDQLHTALKARAKAQGRTLEWYTENILSEALYGPQDVIPASPGFRTVASVDPVPFTEPKYEPFE